MWVGDKLESAASKWALIFMLGLSIGTYKGCSYGEKRAYKSMLQENQSIITNKKNPYVLMYDKIEGEIYSVPLKEIKTQIKIKNSNLEKITQEIFK